MATKMMEVQAEKEFQEQVRKEKEEQDQALVICYFSKTDSIHHFTTISYLYHLSLTEI